MLWLAGFKEAKSISTTTLDGWWNRSRSGLYLVFIWFVCAVALLNMDAPSAIKKIRWRGIFNFWVRNVNDDGCWLSCQHMCPHVRFRWKRDTHHRSPPLRTPDPLWTMGTHQECTLSQAPLQLLLDTREVCVSIHFSYLLEKPIILITI